MKRFKIYREDITREIKRGGFIYHGNVYNFVRSFVNYKHAKEYIKADPSSYLIMEEKMLKQGFNK